MTPWMPAGLYQTPLTSTVGVTDEVSSSSTVIACPSKGKSITGFSFEPKAGAVCVAVGICVGTGVAVGSCVAVGLCVGNGVEVV